VLLIEELGVHVAHLENTTLTAFSSPRSTWPVTARPYHVVPQVIAHVELLQVAELLQLLEHLLVEVLEVLLHLQDGASWQSETHVREVAEKAPPFCRKRKHGLTSDEIENVGILSTDFEIYSTTCITTQLGYR
jgi:hypothetical protein